MISWMQRHRKYLVITIWISTIAFIGAGFVGWGQYSYGDKSGAVAKVGDVSISSRELQATYSRLFNQYSQMLKGQFDQEQAQKMGLDKQALRQLVNEALLINLANSYNLVVDDSEVAASLQQQDPFFENGIFSKSLYIDVLKQNRLTPTEYESDLRKMLLIQKVLALFPIKTAPLEKEAFETALGIADKIEYKILTPDSVTVDTSESKLKAYWEMHQNDYLTPRAYKVAYFLQPTARATYSDEALKTYYDEHKYDFAGPDGKLLDFETAKTAVHSAMDGKATHKAALQNYLAFKKEKLDDAVEVTEATISDPYTPFSTETMRAVASADISDPYLKPLREKDGYVVIKLLDNIPPAPKSFEAARSDLLVDYRNTQRKQLMLEKAQNELDTFKGVQSTSYLKRTDTKGVKGLDMSETQQLMRTLFASDKASGYAALPTGNMVLYRIIDQQIDAEETVDADQAITQIKTALFNRGLIESLGTRYKTDIFVEGLGQ